MIPPPTVSDGSEVLRKFLRNPWEFQRTFRTPLKDLPRFVATILGAGEAVEEGTLYLDQVVFEPKELQSCVPSGSPLVKGSAICASGEAGVAALLASGLADPVDFLFLPLPKSFVVYADHDEYVTLYANKRAKLASRADALVADGFVEIKDWERTF